VIRYDGTRGVGHCLSLAWKLEVGNHRLLYVCGVLFLGKSESGAGEGCPNMGFNDGDPESGGTVGVFFFRDSIKALSSREVDREDKYKRYNPCRFPPRRAVPIPVFFYEVREACTKSPLQDHIFPTAKLAFLRH